MARRSDEIYLVEITNDSIHRARLTSRKQTLQDFFHQLKIYHQTVCESALISIKTVSNFWNKAYLSMNTMQHAIGRLEKIYGWRNLQKEAKKVELHRKLKRKHLLSP